MNDTNANLVIEADTGLILEKNDAQSQGIPLFSAHWHIFAPTIVILIAYSISWLLLAMADMSGTNLARLFIVVMAVFVPLLAAHAFLRYQTIRVQVNDDCRARKGSSCYSGNNLNPMMLLFFDER